MAVVDVLESHMDKMVVQHIKQSSNLKHRREKLSGGALLQLFTLGWNKQILEGKETKKKTEEIETGWKNS